MRPCNEIVSHYLVQQHGASGNKWAKSVFGWSDCPFLEQVKSRSKQLHVRQAVLTSSFSRGTLEVALQNCMWSSVAVTSMQRWTPSRRHSGDLRNDSHVLIFLHSWGVKPINFTLLGNYLSATLIGNKSQLSKVVCRAHTIYLWSLVLCPNTQSSLHQLQ